MKRGVCRYGGGDALIIRGVSESPAVLGTAKKSIRSRQIWQMGDDAHQFLHSATHHMTVT